MKPKGSILLFVFLFFAISVKAQTYFPVKDTVKIITILKEVRKKYGSDKNFTAVDSIKLANAYELAQKINFLQGKIQYFDILGVFERNRANYSQALEYHQKALQLIAGDQHPKERTIILNNIGVVYRRLDDLNQATRYHLSALEIAESINDRSSICVSLNSLGNIYLAKKEYDLALKNFNAALEKEKESKNLLGQAINYNNIGSVYEQKGDFKRATDFYLKSLETNKILGSQKGIAICYLSLGDIYIKMNSPMEAGKYLKLGYDIQASSDDRIYMASCLIKLGNLSAYKKEYPQAIEYFKQGLAIAQSIKSKTNMNKAYLGLSEAFEFSGKIPLSLKFYKLAITYQDSILDEDKARDLNLKQVLYETGKKDKEIELLKYKQQVKDKKQKLIVGVLISGCLILLVFSSLIFFNFRLKQKAHNDLLHYNRDIEEKNRILIQQKEEIMAQNDEIEFKNQQINEAYETIKVKTNNITDNIHYAVQIQHSLLPEESFIKMLFPQSFVYYAPKDMVSGDFYWAAQKKSKKILAVADCTGHGVTGAFMSILGINALNEAVNEKGLTVANDILNHMRGNIVRTLQQGISYTESKEGIHMVVCTFNETMTHMQFAGAINSIMVLRGTQIFQYKGDKMPVSISPDMTDFSKTEISIQKDDMVYLYSDGYYGQFGGSDDRKFNTYRFKSLLQKVSKLPIEEQMQIINNTMQSWKGIHEQVDDMLVMGIRV